VKIDSEQLTNENATAWLARGVAAIRDGDTAFDLSAVRAVDSAAVALLLAWQREAQARGGRLALSGVPSGLNGLADLYGVSALLGLNGAAA
jgi:phospholipid transport system transporter-binding protein